MTLRVKALTLVFVSVAILMGSVEVLFSHVLLDQMVSLEREQITQHAVRVREALQSRIQSIPVRQLDWAAWDSTYDFMKTRDKNYIESNLVTSGIVGLEANFIVYFDTSNKPILEKAVDFRNGVDTPMPASLFEIFSPTSELLRGLHEHTQRSGLIFLDQKPLLFGLRPILRSDQTGPSRGALLWARYLDSVEIASMMKELRVDFVLSPSTTLATFEPYAKAVSNNEIHGFAALSDSFRKKALVIDVKAPRTLYQRGLEADGIVLAGVLLSGLIFALIVAITLERFVIARIRRSASELRRIAREDDFDGRLQIEGKDEIALLADEINGTLEALAQGRHGMRIAKEWAETASANKSLFVSTMSHEIRTPLNGIIGMAESLRRDSLTQEQKDKVDVMTDCAESLIAIVNDVLDFAKIEAGKMEIEAINFSLDELCQRSINTVLERARQKGIELKTDLSDSMPKFFVGDPTRLGQVIINLLSNAVKFTTAGSVTLRVELVATKLDRAVLTFSIVDTGIGMTPLQRSRVFEAFNQADASIGRRFGGTGLGLSICQQIVELMGSSLQVESTPGKGSTFSFELILPLGSKKELERKEFEVIPTRNPQSIVVVDDKESNLKVASFHLRTLGHKCRTLSSGHELLELLDKVDCQEEDDIDLVLLDIQMPLLSGPETAALLRGSESFKGRSFPIVALTAQAETDFGMQEADRKVFDDWISKPLRMVTLAAVIEKFSKAKTAFSEENAPKQSAYSRWPSIAELDTGFLWENYLESGTILEMLECFYRESKELLEQFDNNFAHDDTFQSARSLHALRGSLNNIGAIRLALSAKELERTIASIGESALADSGIVKQVAQWRKKVDALRMLVREELGVAYPDCAALQL